MDKQIVFNTGKNTKTNRERGGEKRTHVNGIEYDIRCKNSTGRITEVQKTPILCDNIKHRMVI